MSFSHRSRAPSSKVISRSKFHIFRLEGPDEWTLEVIDEDDASLVWNDAFQSDEAAWQAFEDDVKEMGLAKLIAAEETTLH